MDTIPEQAFTIHDLRARNSPPAQWIDVRSASEFAAGHIPGAINIPMDEIESRLPDLSLDQPIILICQAGKRAAMTHSILTDQMPNLAILQGGTDAWASAGLPLVTSARSRWSLERQVRLAAGVLVLTGVVLGFVVNRIWFGLAGFVGAGLIFAGTTNYCAMANLLGLLPWNRRRATMKANACTCA